MCLHCDDEGVLEIANVLKKQTNDFLFEKKNSFKKKRAVDQLTAKIRTPFILFIACIKRQTSRERNQNAECQ